MTIPELIKRIWSLSGEALDREVRKAEKEEDGWITLIYVYVISRFKFINDPDNNSAIYSTADWIKGELEGQKDKTALIFGYVTADDNTFREIVLDLIASFEDEELYALFDNDKIEESVDMNETYSDKELRDLQGRTFNQQKIQSIYRRTKYGAKRLLAATKCIKCGRTKVVYLSNLINDPDKYGSCVCSDINVDSKVDSATSFYNGTKRLSNNTSGYTGVSYVKEYDGKPYDKWRAYIEVDGKRTYLGDFTFKKDAVEARKLAGEKGIEWYKANRNSLLKEKRKKSKGKYKRGTIDFFVKNKK